MLPVFVNQMRTQSLLMSFVWHTTAFAVYFRDLFKDITKPRKGKKVKLIFNIGLAILFREEMQVFLFHSKMSKKNWLGRCVLGMKTNFGNFEYCIQAKNSPTVDFSHFCPRCQRVILRLGNSTLKLVFFNKTMCCWIQDSMRTNRKQFKRAKITWGGGGENNPAYSISLIHR